VPATTTKSVLLIGLGNVGVGFDLSDSRKVLSHARAFSRHPYFNLAAGVDTDAERRRRFEAAYGVPSFDDVGAATREVSPDVVVVATPTCRPAGRRLCSARSRWPTTLPKPGESSRRARRTGVASP
jgi:hypothetical protein